MKKGILMLAFLAITGVLKAQDYYQAFGIQANVGMFKVDEEASLGPESEAVFVPGIFYKATLAFEINRDMSFALSAYPFVGMSGSFNSQNGASANASFGAEFPLLAELYFGDPDDICFFLGAGFSASAMASTYGSGSIVGPQLEIGGQFELGSTFLGARAAFTYGLNKPDHFLESTKYGNNLLSVGVYYLFG